MEAVSDFQYLSLLVCLSLLDCWDFRGPAAWSSATAHGCLCLAGLCAELHLLFPVPFLLNLCVCLYRLGPHGCAFLLTLRLFLFLDTDFYRNHLILEAESHPSLDLSWFAPFIPSHILSLTRVGTPLRLPSICPLFVLLFRLSISTV